MNVLDIVLLVVILLFTMVGYQKGLVRSLVGFVGYLVASLAAAMLGRTAAVYVYQNFFYSRIVEKITAVLQQTAGQSVSQQAQALETSFPAMFVNPLKQQGMTADSLGTILSRSIEESAPRIADLLSPAVINVTRLALTVILFSIFIMLVQSLVRIVSAVFRLPVLRQINCLFGGVFGLFTGGAVVLLLCLLLQLSIPMTKDGLFGMTQKDLDSSRVYQTLYQNTPVYSLFPEE